VKSKNEVVAGKHQERVQIIYDRVKKLYELALSCWNDPQQYLTDETVVALRVPALPDMDSFQEDTSQVDKNFGFPQIPPATPFR